MAVVFGGGGGGEHVKFFDGTGLGLVEVEAVVDITVPFTHQVLAVPPYEAKGSKAPDAAVYPAGHVKPARPPPVANDIPPALGKHLPAEPPLPKVPAVV